jgi:PEP-CTERM motif
MKYNIKALAVAVFGLGAAATLQAANFTTSTSESSGTDWTAAIWQGTSPSAGNTYEALSGALIRTPTGGGTVTFAGDSLQFDAGSDLRTKGPAGNEVTVAAPVIYQTGTAAGFILNGGFLGMGDDNQSEFNSLITVNAASAIYGGQDATSANSNQQQAGFRSVISSAGLAGSGNLTFGNALYSGNLFVAGANTTFANTANFAFTGNGSLYTGNILVTAGWLQAGSVNAFGSANITIAGSGPVSAGANSVAAPAQFDATTAFSDTGTLTVNSANSTLLLDNNMVLGGAIIDGTTLAPGVYTEATLAGEFSNVTGTPTDTLTVVPEPSSIALAMAGGLGILVLRRRRA